MPSICGIIYFENERLITNELDLMSEVLRKNPADSFISHVEKSAGLLKVNHNEEDAGQDLFRLPSGELVLSKAKIENKPEIAKLLHLKPDKNGDFNDTELIARSYRKFGNNCIDILKGSYAFAVYDPANRQFTLGRDQEGKAQLFYAYRKNRHLAFSTDIQALLSLPSVEDKLDGHQMVKFVLSLEREAFPEDQHTLYRNIYSIQQGNCLEINRNSIWTKVSSRSSVLSCHDMPSKTNFSFWPKNA